MSSFLFFFKDIGHVKKHISSSVATACCFVNCKKVFSSAKSFTSHVSRFHGSIVCPRQSVAQCEEDLAAPSSAGQDFTSVDV